MSELKMQDRAGRQIVTVDNQLAYAWDGATPLEVGDEVVVPGTWFAPDDRLATVTKLGSTFAGTLVAVKRKYQS